MTDESVLPEAQLLLVDDEPNILASLRRLLRGKGYVIRMAEGGQQALQLLEQEPADVILSDMRMPGMSGAEFLAEARKRWPESVRILVTGYADIDSTVSAVNEGGIHRYIHKPWNDDELLTIVRDAVDRKRLVDERNQLLATVERQNTELNFLNEGLEDAVRARTAELRQTSSFLELTNKKLKESYLSTLHAFSNLVELRQKSLAGHGKRVADSARKMAALLGIGGQEVNDITVAALLHDIGKIGWSDEMFGKPLSVFTPEERRLANKHPAVAESVLAELENMRGALRVIRHHHERFDGSGYPDALAGLDIPMGARLLAVANDYDGLQLGSITQRRRTPPQALDMIREGAGTRYDPAAVDAFLEVMGVARAEAEASGRVSPAVRMESAQLQVGMKLATDLMDADGRLLLKRGYVLSQLLVDQIRHYEDASGNRLDITITQ